MTRAGFESIPFRDDLSVYVKGLRCRSRAFPLSIFTFMGDDENHPSWDCCAVTVVDSRGAEVPIKELRDIVDRARA
jgi:hypothetical protein